MTGRLNGVQIDVSAQWTQQGISGQFTAGGPGARVIAEAFQRNSEVVYSGPVQKGDTQYMVVVRVRVERFPTRGEPEAEHRGTFRAEGEPIDVAPLDENA